MTATNTTDAMVEAACREFYEPPYDWDSAGEDDKGVARDSMRAALEAAERAAWVPAHEAPAAWEGTVVLLARDGALERGHLQVWFSRKPEHCRGVLVRPMPQPPEEIDRG